MPPPPIPYATNRCPACQTGQLESPSFTWWGGLIGHKILNIHRCANCKKWWVINTNTPGQPRIIIYLIAGFLIFGALGLLWAFR